MMFKRKGGGIKGLLNNVKKKLHFSYVSASLRAQCTQSKDSQKGVDVWSRSDKTQLTTGRGTG